MCGRFTQVQDVATYMAELDTPQLVLGFLEPEPIGRYNVAPRTKVQIIRSTDGGVRVDGVRWGWAPFWAAERKIPPAINARVETVATNKFFKSVWPHRALVMADGWYEWVKHPENDKIKQPYYITRKGGGVMFFAALCQVHEGLEQAESDGFTIITAAANQGLLDIHDRRPVVLAPAMAREWLEPDVAQERAQEIARDEGLSANAFEWYPVGPAVGNVKNEGAALTEKIEHPLFEITLLKNG